MSSCPPPASDESSILRDVRSMNDLGLLEYRKAHQIALLLENVRWGLIECDTAVEMLQELGYEYSEACDAVAEAMAQLEHR